MPAYVWKGKTRDGKSVSGERVADSKEAVMALLRRDQILVSSVKEKGKEMAIPKFGGGVPAMYRRRPIMTPNRWNPSSSVTSLSDRVSFDRVNRS